MGAPRDGPKIWKSGSSRRVDSYIQWTTFKLRSPHEPPFCSEFRRVCCGGSILPGDQNLMAKPRNAVKPVGSLLIKGLGVPQDVVAFICAGIYIYIYVYIYIDRESASCSDSCWRQRCFKLAVLLCVSAVAVFSCLLPFSHAWNLMLKP